MTSSRDMPSVQWSLPKLLLNNQFCYHPAWPAEGTDISGKVAIITGANTGLGLESARQLLDIKLSHLIIAVRSTEKGEAAASELRSKHPKAKIEVWALDLAAYDSVQAFARRAQDLPRLDIAILNAGMSTFKFATVPATGHLDVMQVNYLSTVLLATLLLPTLRDKSPAGEPGKMTIINSGLAIVAAFKNQNESPLLPSFDDPKHFDSMDTYSTTKTLAHLWLYKAADYISPDDVVVNLADPGYVKGTELQRDAPRAMQFIGKTMSSFVGRPPRDGASSYVDAVVMKGKESHGCFLMNWKIHHFAHVASTPEGKQIMERLWKETNEELQFANVLGILESMKKGYA